MEENSKLSKTEAQEEVSEMMFPKDRNLLFKKYKRILKIFAQFNKRKLNRNIKKEGSTFMEKKRIQIWKRQFPVFLINIDKSLISCWRR